MSSHDLGLRQTHELGVALDRPRRAGRGGRRCGRHRSWARAEPGGGGRSAGGGARRGTPARRPRSSSRPTKPRTNSRSRRAASSRCAVVWARRSSGSSPARARSASPSSSIQRSTSAPSTSGWNCNPRARPEMKACVARSLRAISVAPGGAVRRSKCHWNHVPPGTRSDLLLDTSCQPTSGSGERATVPRARGPATARRSTPEHSHARGQCAPRHRDLAGHPAVGKTVVVDRPARSEGTIAS